MSSSQVEGLTIKLTKAQEHLAELIDEVVYSEKQAEAWELKFSRLEPCVKELGECLENLLGYCTRLEQVVIMPALGDLHHALIGYRDVASKRAMVLEATGRVIGNAQFSHHVSPRMQKIFELMRKPSTSAQELTERREGSFNRAGPVSEVEDAFVMCDAMLSSKEDLSTLLAETNQRLLRIRTRERREDGGSLTSPDPEDVSSNVDLKDLLVKVQHERDILLQKVKTQQPLDELQRQWHGERDRLQQRILTLETAAAETSRERQAVHQRFEVLQQSLEEGGLEREALREELSKLRKQTDGGRFTSSFSQRTSSPTSQGEGIPSPTMSGNEHALRLEIDRLVREHSSVVTRIQEENASLRADLQIAQHNSAHNRGLEQQLVQLQRNNETLRKDLTHLQQQVASSSTSQPNQTSLENKIRSFELTVEELNRELSLVDRKIAEIERSHNDERERLITAFDTERLQYKNDREECDSLVVKMTNELEFLIRENGSLKQRLQVTPQRSHGATR